MPIAHLHCRWLCGNDRIKQGTVLAVSQRRPLHNREQKIHREKSEKNEKFPSIKSSINDAATLPDD